MARAGADRGHDAFLVHQLYRAFLLRGFTAREAGNLTAVIIGLRIHRVPWTWRQIAILLAMQHNARLERSSLEGR